MSVIRKNASAEARLREALADLLNCVDGQHDQEWLTRCKDKARAALSAGGDEAKKSEGGTSPSNETMGGTGDDCSVGKCGVWPPEGADRQKHGLNDISQKQVVTAGETATPSDPPDRRKIVLRAINGIYGIGIGTFAGGYQDKSIERAADAILAALGGR